MTTPKPPTLAMWTAIDADAKQPFRELAEEFRRLAAEAKANIDHWEFQTEHYQAVYRTRYQDFEQAAQMLEERLNG